MPPKSAAPNASRTKSIRTTHGDAASSSAAALSEDQQEQSQQADLDPDEESTPASSSSAAAAASSSSSAVAAADWSSKQFRMRSHQQLQTVPQTDESSNHCAVAATSAAAAASSSAASSSSSAASASSSARVDPLSSSSRVRLATAEFHCILSFLSLSDIAQCTHTSHQWKQRTEQITAQFLFTRGSQLTLQTTRARLDDSLAWLLRRRLLHRLVVLETHRSWVTEAELLKELRKYDGNDARLKPGESLEEEMDMDPNALTAADLQRIAQLVPHLQHLICKLRTEKVVPLLQYAFPSSLRSLVIAPINEKDVLRLFERVFDAASLCPSLEVLSVCSRQEPSNLRVTSLKPRRKSPPLVVPPHVFDALVKTPSPLHTFRMDRWGGDLQWPMPSLQALMSLPNLTVLDIGIASAESLQDLTSCGPACERLTDINLKCDVDDTMTSSLRQLVGLQVFAPDSVECDDCSFIASLTRLERVMLHCEEPTQGFEVLVQSLQHCTRITHLELGHEMLESVHLQALLTGLPRLHTLRFIGASHVSDFRSLLLAPALRVFCLVAPMRLTDAHHLTPLRQLRNLEQLYIARFVRFSSEVVSAQFRAEIDPKSPLFRTDLWPNLKSCSDPKW